MNFLKITMHPESRSDFSRWSIAGNECNQGQDQRPAASVRFEKRNQEEQYAVAGRLSVFYVYRETRRKMLPFCAYELAHRSN
jgi:hypothetical protein